MLAAGTAAQAAFSAIGIGLPAIAPALRDEFGLALAEVGVLLSAEWIGLTVTLLAWGLLADRIGERRSLGLGLGGCGLLLCAAAFAPGFWWLVVLVALAGAVGGSVQSASGRAVMAWFEPSERGFALGIRQTAVPVGGLIGALALPAAVAAGGVDAAFLLLGGLCLAGAIVGAAFIRDRAHVEAVEAHDVPWTLADRRLWLLCFGSGLYLVAQMAIFGFAVLFLVDERAFSHGDAAGVLAGVQAAGAVLRLAVGRWSDALGARVAPLRWIGLAAAVTLALAVLLLDAPAAVLVPALILAGGVSMAWNGLSYTAAAELAGRRRSGAAIGFQQTVLSVMGVAVPVAFAATVAATSWRAAFALAALGPLAGWLALRPLAERPEPRTAVPGAGPRPPAGGLGGAGPVPVPGTEPSSRFGTRPHRDPALVPRARHEAASTGQTGPVSVPGTEPCPRARPAMSRCQAPSRVHEPRPGLSRCQAPSHASAAVPNG